MAKLLSPGFARQDFGTSYLSRYNSKLTTNDLQLCHAVRPGYRQVRCKTDVTGQAIGLRTKR